MDILNLISRKAIQKDLMKKAPDKVRVLFSSLIEFYSERTESEDS